MSDCVHPHFYAQVNVHRIVEPEHADADGVGDANAPAKAFTVDLSVRCHVCGEAFVFMGMPVGLNPHQPMMSFDRREARIPIAPATEFFALAGAAGGGAA